MERKEDVKLDLQIAEIMGLKVVEDPVNYRGYAVNEAGPHGADLPHFCTKLDEAMKVWDHVRMHGARWLLNVDTEGFHLRRVACITERCELREKHYAADKHLGWAKKIEELPKIICEAAIAEKNVEDGESIPVGRASGFRKRK